jgi:hypothetical protein
MMLVPMIWLALGGMGDGPDPAALVEKLGASAPSDRDRAAGALDEIGLPALPALREARTGGDPEFVRRVASLIGEIGRQRLLRPTRIALDLDDQPLEDAVAALRRESGVALTLMPGGDPRWRERHVSLHAPKGIGFWEALDRIGASGGVRLDTTPQPRGPAFRLIPHDGPPAPSAFAGPYRVLVTGLHEHRQVALAPVPAESKAREEFHIGLQVAAEPGLIIDRNGPTRLLEAIDDLDRDLRAAQVAEPGRPSLNPGRRWDATDISTLTESIALKLPEPPANRIKRLRGYVPITAVARTGRVLSFSLRGAEGQTFSAGGVTVVVQKFGVEHGRPTPLVLLIYDAPGTEPPALPPGPNQRTLGPLRLPYNYANHVQVVDARGRPHVGGFNGRPTPDGKGGTQLTIFPNANSSPVEVRYYDIAAVATEVPFDFTDLPMP